MYKMLNIFTMEMIFVLHRDCLQKEHGTSTNDKSLFFL
jgi:hypothetical protein